MSNRAEQSPPVSVVAAVVARDLEAVPETLAAIERQVYGADRVVLVGRSDEVRALAEKSDSGWAPSVESLLDSTEPSVGAIWFVEGGALPRPRALGALVADSERAGAPLAGSKILDAADTGRLVSVGLATDVFGIPYTGLDADELDAGQYDVVRDVAAVDGPSMLVRRDLAKGLRGFDPLLPPRAAAVDLSNRARLRGARVVVTPSSEVEYHTERHAVSPWRLEAGYLRAMLKSYGPLTLLWAVPLSFLVGLLEGIVSPLFGRWTLFRWAAAWVWNLLHIFSTLRRRRVARRGGVVTDAELYRYQVRGSVKLRNLLDLAGDRIAQSLGPEERSSLADVGRELRRPAFLAGLVAVAFVVVATRSVWSNGFPASGYSLPLPASGADALGAYAGGWNPGGFGSTEPLPPLIGLAGALQIVLLDNPTLTSAVLILGSFLFGIWGVTRLLRTWDIGPLAGILGGVALMAGPAARAVAADTGVGTLLGIGVLPWALRIALLRWPSSWRERIGRVASAGWVIGVAALLSPQLVVVPAAALLVWAFLNVTDRGAWRAAVVAIAGGLLALPALLPWGDAVDLRTYWDQGSAFWSPGLISTVALVVALVATLIAVPARPALVAAWGGVLIGGGAVLARSGDFGPGREAGHLGLAVVAIGTAVLVGAGVEGIRRVIEVTGWRRVVAGVAAAGAVTVAASGLLVVTAGRAGLPAPELADRIGFIAAAEGDPSASRVLLIGPGDALPGDSRSVRGAGYRVVSAPMPRMWEAWLPEVSAFDEALEADLEAMIDGTTFRAGEALAPYGIRWVISMGETPLEEVFAGQLDLVLLGAREGLAFTVEGEPPVRAVADDGTAWTRTPWGYEGAPGPGRVTLAESSDSRWEPDGQAAGPGTSISAVEGEGRFEPIRERRTQAMFAGGLLVVLIAAAWVGRRRL